MSGGHFNYCYNRISDLVDELQYEIDNNDVNGMSYSKDTIERLIKAHNVFKTASQLAREVEWLYSGDTGEENFQILIDDILS